MTSLGIRPTSTAGDINGDGYADVIIGASNWDNPASTDRAGVRYLC